ncbi:hypothetical protein [Streptosporangium sp. CA-115845]|uniref:hypothetical protein n=1 Tax=Streptosporangium sp. CA-115845 TaxID=3240071 RepID=UPI003D90F7ED
MNHSPNQLPCLVPCEDTSSAEGCYVIINREGQEVGLPGWSASHSSSVAVARQDLLELLMEEAHADGRSQDCLTSEEEEKLFGKILRQETPYRIMRRVESCTVPKCASCEKPFNPGNWVWHFDSQENAREVVVQHSWTLGQPHGWYCPSCSAKETS